MKTINLDHSVAAADWIKGGWDLPPYKSPEFFCLVPLAELEEFRKLPVYTNAVKTGLIYDDEWVGDYTARDPVDELAERLLATLEDVGSKARKLAKAQTFDDSQIKRAVMPHVPPLASDVKVVMNKLSLQVAKRMAKKGRFKKLRKVWDVRGALEERFHVKVTDKTDQLIPLQPVLSALYGLLDELCEGSPLLKEIYYGYELMDIVIYPDDTIKSGCYAGGMADYEIDEATLYVAGGRYLERDQLKIGEGEHNVAKDLRFVMAHELGHVCQEGVERAYGKKFKIIYDQFPREYWKRKVSQYCETSDHECFAECFATYTHPNYAGGLPQAVVDVFQAVGINPRMLAKSKKKTDDEEVDDLLDAVGDADWFLLEDTLKPAMVEAFKRAGYSEAASVGLDISFDQIDQMAVEYAEAHAAELVTEISDSTEEMLRSTVRDALDDGWSQAELADRIEDSFAFSEYRSAMIAQTELAIAHVQGRVASATENGAVGKQSLLSADHDDALTCSCAEAADAGVIPIEDNFVPDDEDSDFPPYHPNCWCDCVFVYPTDQADDAEDDEADEANDEE